VRTFKREAFAVKVGEEERRIHCLGRASSSNGRVARSAGLRDAILASFFGLTGESKRNLIAEVVLLAGGPREGELLSYVFSPLREGDVALYRGSGAGLAPILLVAAEDTSLGSVERQVRT
jgi:hypothetical protein